jgi:FixJ family two-component response regulator
MADRSPSIAIVDDDPSVLKALARLLRARSFNVTTYQSAHEFLAVLPGNLPECLIVDWQMPNMNGLELLQDLRRAGIRVPAIIISAHGDTSVRQRYKSAGAIAFLSKPLQDSELLAAINRARSERKPSA